VFNCPANLASHKRWHKPKVESEKSIDMDVEESPINEIQDLSVLKPDATVGQKIEILPNKSEDRNIMANSSLENQTYNYFGNNEWLSEMYKNYFAAAAAAVAQNYLQPTTNYLQSNNLFYNPTAICQNNIQETKRQNFTCKYCYLTFSDNYILNFHIQKSHSSILMNFN
jgi:hypothetical protein